MKKIFAITAFALGAAGVQSCLDYPDPGQELNPSTKTTSDIIYVGEADKIDYKKAITDAGVRQAAQTLETNLAQALGGEYSMRGGKEAALPGAHAYQYQFTFGPDIYAQYFVSPHYKYLGGTLRSTYDLSKDFYGGPGGGFTLLKNAVVPLLNHPQVDSIPEIKAINLLLFNYSAQEVADIYGPMPYVDFKANRQQYPYTYNDLRTIYVNIEANLDSIVNCLRHYEDNRSEAYKAVVQDILNRKTEVNLDSKLYGRTGFDTWIRLANSLKLRMAMHIVKVDPALAKKWAEEAVKSGVVESKEQQSVLAPMFAGFTNPLMQISAWGDIRLTASFESLLASLNHPYLTNVFEKNNGDLVNSNTQETLAKGTRVVGLRAGIHPGAEQDYAQNMMAGYSALLQNGDIAMAPLYLMKWSEVDFLRAEGALRGWDMGGTAQEFYERGIRNGDLCEPLMGSAWYNDAMDAYMAQEAATPYTYHDPMGKTPDMESVTKIGVKWNEADTPETKLEKIITQKYIALFPYSNEAWVDLRRTGYPKLFPVLNPSDGDGSLKYGDIIRRIPFTGDDAPTKKDIETTGIPALGGPDLQGTRLWWDVAAPNF